MLDRRWPRAGRRCSANRCGIVAMVSSRGCTSSISSQAIGAEHRALGVAAHRVGAGDRVVARVLVEIDEHLGRVTVLAPPRRSGMVRDAALDLAGEGERGLAHLGEVPAGLDADVDVDAVPARGLGIAGDVELVEDLVHGVGHPRARCQMSTRASDRCRSATRRASRRRRGESSRGETRPWPSARPRSRWPAR